MLSSLSRRDRRALAAGLLLLGPLVLWKTILVPGVAELTELSTTVQTERALLQRELSVLASVRAERRSAEGLVASVASFVPRTFSASSDSEERLRMLAAENNVEIEQLSRDEADTTTPSRAAIRSVRFRLTATSDLEGILTLLGAFHSDARLLVTEEIALEALKVPLDGPETLRLSASVLTFEGSGFVLEMDE